MSDTTESTTEQTATGEGVATETQPVTTETPAETTETKPTEPVVYAEFTPPEGVTTLDKTVLDAVTAYTATLGLTQEQVQGLVNVAAPLLQQNTLAQRDALLVTFAEQVKADPELGGVNQEKNIAVAQRALNTFATPELKALLEQGMGSHPEVIRMFLRIGNKIKEDTLVSGDNSGNIDTSHLSAVERLKIARRQA